MTSKYLCVICGHSIPLSIVDHRNISTGDKPVPEMCFDCKRDQERLCDETGVDDIRELL